MSLAVLFPMSERRLPAAPMVPRPGARRALFGGRRSNAGENREFVRRELRALAEEAKVKWNYDFEAERPLPGGRYDWEPVREGAVPEAYHLAVDRRRATDVNEVNATTSSSSNSNSTSDAINNQDGAKTTGLLIQTHIQDFMRTRKRSLSSSSQSKVSLVSPSSLTNDDDQLPKNKLRRTSSS